MPILGIGSGVDQNFPQIAQASSVRAAVVVEEGIQSAATDARFESLHNHTDRRNNEYW